MRFCSTVAAIGCATLIPIAPAIAKEQSQIPEELLVTASRIEMPLRQIGAAVSVIDRERIEGLGYVTAPEVLRTLPSIHVSANGGLGSVATLRMRGEDGFRTRVLVDGVNLDDTTGVQHTARVEHLLLGDIERIEVLRGAQGMMYGADAGGVINIITRRGEPGLSGDVSYESGRYGFEHATSSLRAGAERFEVSAHYSELRNDGFNARTSDTVLRDDDGYDNTSRSIRGGFAVTDDIRIDATLRSNRSSNEYDSCFQGFATIHDCRLDYDQFQQRVALSRALDTAGYSLSWQHSRFERESYVAGVLDTAFGVFEGESTQWQAMAHREIGAGNLIGGVDFKEETDERNREQRDQRAAWFEWQGTLSDDFFYTMGLRHDNSEDYGDFLTHRVTLARILALDSGNEIKLRASHGSGFRVPALQEIRYNQQGFVPVAARDLQEETSRGFDLGIEYHTAALHAGVTVFRQLIRDPIEFSETSFYYIQETGESHSEGVEIEAAVALHASLRLHGNATYNDTESADGGQRARRPRQTYNLGLNWDVPRLPLTLTTQVRRVEDVVDKPFGAARQRLDDYTKLDVTASWRVAENIDVWARAENLLDDEYVEALTYTTAGAAVYGGIRLRFN